MHHVHVVERDTSFWFIDTYCIHMTVYTGIYMIYIYKYPIYLHVHNADIQLYHIQIRSKNSRHFLGYDSPEIPMLPSFPLQTKLGRPDI